VSGKVNPEELIKVELVFDPNKNPLAAGLRVNWVDGEDDDSEINLSCGAGVGSPYMVFSRKDKKTGKTKYAVCDIRPMINALGEAMA
jgi:hypothetical protein